MWKGREANGRVDDAAVLYDKHKEFKIITARKEERPNPSKIFFEGATYVAKLIAVPAVGESDKALLEKSEEFEYLADAVENL